VNFEVLAIGSNCPTLNPLSQPDETFSTVFQIPVQLQFDRSGMSFRCCGASILLNGYAERPTSATHFSFCG